MLGQFLISHAVAIITTIIVVPLVIHLLASHRTPQSLFAWLLALALVPPLGVPLYLMFGTRKIGRHQRHDKPHQAQPSHQQTPVQSVLRSAGVRAPCHHRGLRLHDGVSAFQTLLALINDAQESIHLTFFILGRDAVAEQLVQALSERARAGVDVRLIVDAVGSRSSFKLAKRRIEAAGGQVRHFMPLLHAPFRGVSNLRNHRKIAIFDRQHLFTGGMNLAQEYMGPTVLAGRWRDLAVTVSGDVATDAEQLFVSDWEFCTGERLPNPAHETSNRGMHDEPGTALVQLVASGPDSPEDVLYDALLTAIFSARERLTIVTPYFVPDETMLLALRLSAQRGVRTEIVVPLHSNHLLADLARRPAFRELAAAGAALLAYPNGMVHAKAMVVDGDFAFVGSFNFDPRSFFLDYENALFIYGREDVTLVRNWIDSLIKDCQAIDPVHTHELRLIEQLAQLVAPEL